MLLSRHASAGERLSSLGEDRVRRLDRTGRVQARSLPALLAHHEIERIVSSPHTRCVETVAPLALARGLAIEFREELAPDASRGDTLALVAGLPDSTFVCTHREVFERLFGGEVTCAKGGVWITERKPRRRAPVPVAYLPPPSSTARVAAQATAAR
jgi:phosphohistidine phosphatase SixA